jgi:thiol-disulfide isomerase/thioredoxin
MKKLLMVLLCIGFATVGMAQELPKTQIKDLSTGKKVTFNETIVKGKVTVVSFWATWCIPCKKEIKNIANALDSWHQQAEFDFITVSIDESRAEGMARTYAISQGWKFPFYIDNNSDLKRSLNFQSVPYTLIIDKKGKVAFTHIGYEEGGEAQVLEKIKELAAEKL